MKSDGLYTYDSMYDPSLTLGSDSITIDLSSSMASSDIMISGNNTINGSITSGLGGYVYTTTTTGTAPLTYPWATDSTLSVGSCIPGSILNVEGSADIKGSLKVGGKDIGESLERIEQRLAILRPNSELESRWDRLRELGEEYRKLEKDILGQEEIYNILKK